MLQLRKEHLLLHFLQLITLLPFNRCNPLPLANRRAIAYIRCMKMFGSKMDIGGGLGDFWDYIREPRPHRWAIWGVALALTYIVFNGVSNYLIPYEKPKAQIIYFENWSANRSAEQVRADWVARARETTRRNAEKRAEYQRLADMMGVEYDSTEADKVTRQTLGEEGAAAAMRKPAPPPRSTLAERAARGAPAPAAAALPAPKD